MPLSGPFAGRLEDSRGETVDVSVSKITQRTLAVETEVDLEFGQEVTVTVGPVTLAGEVVFVSDQPRGAVLSFEVDGLVELLQTWADSQVGADLRRAAGAFEASREEDLATAVDLPAETESGPFPTAIDAATHSAARVADMGDKTDHDGRVFTDVLSAEIMAAAELDDADPEDPETYREPETRPEAGAEALASEVGLGARGPSAEFAGTPEAPTEALGGDAASAVSEPMGLPVLGADGSSVQFPSAASFLEQYDTHISRGGLVVVSAPLTIGAQHTLRFSVPGLSEVVEVGSQVGFVGDGTVGFMIESFAVNKPKLEAAVRLLS